MSLQIADALHAPSSATAEDVLAIQTSGLRKRFGHHEVLRGVDLRIPEGTISVILGPSGTGKSVLIKHVVGLLQPDAGGVRVHNRDLAAMSHREVLDLRREIGVMFQDGALFSSMSVYDNVAFPLRQHTDFDEDAVRPRVMEQLRAVGLEGAATKSPSELSGGMRKRVGLARALMLEPRILLCDEPDSGLDPVRTSLLGALLQDRHAELGGTVVVVTHNIALARLVADHVSLLWEGRVVAAGDAEAMFSSDHEFARQFLAGDAVGPLGME